MSSIARTVKGAPPADGRPRLLRRGPGSVLLALIATILFALLATPATALAARHAGQPTVLHIGVTENVALGGHAVVTVLLEASGRPIPGQLVSIRLGDKVTHQLKTGANGKAAVEIARDLPAGHYQVSARFAGTPAWRSSTSKTAVFTVTPVHLTVATVPATPGIPLLRVGDGPPLVTGPDGKVVATITQAGPTALHLALPPDDATRQFRLARWDDGSTESVRMIRVPDNLSASVGLEILRPVQFAFTSSDGTPIAAGDVPSVSISNDTGDQQTLTGTGTHFLPSNAITRLVTGLSSSPVEYRVTQVPLGGQNAVNQGQQRFDVLSPQTLTVPLLAFNLVVQGRDALLKTPSGAKVTITDTAGGKRVLDLGADSTTSTLLPRGEYTVAITGGTGFAVATPVVLSREQHADVLMVTMLDIVLVVGVALAIMVSLILIGRPHFIRRRRGDRSGGPDAPGPPLPQWPEPSVAHDWRQGPRP
jgi:hypothetical protein